MSGTFLRTHTTILALRTPAEWPLQCVIQEGPGVCDCMEHRPPHLNAAERPHLLSSSPSVQGELFTKILKSFQAEGFLGYRADSYPCPTSPSGPGSADTSSPALLGPTSTSHSALPASRLCPSPARASLPLKPKHVREPLSHCSDVSLIPRRLRF